MIKSENIRASHTRGHLEYRTGARKILLSVKFQKERRYKCTLGRKSRGAARGAGRPPKHIVDAVGYLDSGNISLAAHPPPAGNGACRKLASLYFEHKSIVIWEKKLPDSSGSDRAFSLPEIWTLSHREELTWKGSWKFFPVICFSSIGRDVYSFNVSFMRKKPVI